MRRPAPSDGSWEDFEGDEEEEAAEKEDDILGEAAAGVSEDDFIQKF